MTLLRVKLFVVRHLGDIGWHGQNKGFGYYCTFTVSDYEFGVIIFTVGTDIIPW